MTRHPVHLFFIVAWVLTALTVAAVLGLTGATFIDAAVTPAYGLSQHDQTVDLIVAASLTANAVLLGIWGLEKAKKAWLGGMTRPKP